MKLKQWLLPVMLTCFFISCSKNELTKIPGKENAEKAAYETQKRIKSATNSSGPVVSADYGTKIKSYATDVVLENLINNSDQAQLTAFVNYTVDQIKAKTYNTYGIDLSGEERELVIVYGLFQAARENYIANGGIIGAESGSSSSGGGSSLDCFLTAVVALIGITDAQNIWKSIAAGAAEETVIASLKLMFKRVATVITAVVTIYQVGKCLNWWGGGPTETEVFTPFPNGPSSYNAHIPLEYYQVDMVFYNQVNVGLINYLTNIRGLSLFDANNVAEAVYYGGANYNPSIPGQASVAIDTYGIYVDDYFHYVYNQPSSNGPVGMLPKKEKIQLFGFESILLRPAIG
ncbi:MAG: hypothetical protein J0I41_23320 [Filimonas sp.]|nr:hypothetical protein [Filimonas sp.]